MLRAGCSPVFLVATVTAAHVRTRCFPSKLISLKDWAAEVTALKHLLVKRLDGLNLSVAFVSIVVEAFLKIRLQSCHFCVLLALFLRTLLHRPESISSAFCGREFLGLKVTNI